MRPGDFPRPPSKRADESWRRRVSLVVCDDRLVDGKYEDILSETAPSPLKTPVVVVSPTGDWPDYLKAINAGAFDYLAYPPIPVHSSPGDPLRADVANGERFSRHEKQVRFVKGGNAMNGKPTSVLLAGYLGIQSAVLRQWFARRDCECQLAASFEDACRSLSQAEFNSCALPV